MSQKREKMIQASPPPKPELYAPPAVRVIGSVAELTQTKKIEASHL